MGVPFQPLGKRSPGNFPGAFAHHPRQVGAGAVGPMVQDWVKGPQRDVKHTWGARGTRGAEELVQKGFP